jgi:hypothetical protein
MVVQDGSHAAALPKSYQYRKKRLPVSLVEACKKIEVSL